jgi:hypothetical protein
MNSFICAVQKEEKEKDVNFSCGVVQDGVEYEEKRSLT